MDPQELYDIIMKIDPNGQIPTMDLANGIIDELEANPKRLTFTGKPYIDYQDGKTSLALEVNGDIDDESAPYIRICSYDPDGRHVPLRPLQDEVSIRVIVEVHDGD